MPKIYATPADHLTHCPYDVLCPESYNLVPLAVLANDIAPIFNQIDPSVESRSKRTIVDMANMLQMGLSFKIINDIDTLHILGQIDAYLKYAEDCLGLDRQDVKEFMAKLLPLRLELVAAKRRLLRKHPSWADIYNGLDDEFVKLLYSFISKSGTGAEIPRDIPVQEAVLSAQAQRTGNANPDTLRMPSLKDQLQQARMDQGPPRAYKDTDPSTYDSGMGDL